VTGLRIMVDFDNVDRQALLAGPVALAERIVRALPLDIVGAFAFATVRLYGGWRTNGMPTTRAQRLSADILAKAPLYLRLIPGNSQHFRVDVELALSAVGTTVPFSETLARERDLRGFRARPVPLSQCSSTAACGMQSFAASDNRSPCPVQGCSVRFGDVFCRDEQKIVDTLMVADIAKTALVDLSSHVVVLTSDTDVWPGVLLALDSNCQVLHLHSKRGWRTQRHLIAMLNASTSKRYRQGSI
jgi:hypothetical protein